MIGQKGADVNRAMENGTTPLAMAKSQSHASIVALRSITGAFKL